MIQRHYDDEALMTIVDAGAPSPDTHLGHCAECSDRINGFRQMTEALRDPATWDKRQLDDRPNPGTIALLRAFAGKTATEDATAETYVTALLGGDREGWKKALAAHPEYRTAGTVRRLLAETDRALDTMPSDAVQLTALATDIADHLDDSSAPGDTLTRLRGIAWRDHAYALYYTGQFVEADRAVQIAEAHLGACVVDEYDRARLGIVKALVLRTFERFDEATDTAKSSTRTFLEHGDLSRFASAQMAEAHLLFSAREYAKTADILMAVEAKLQQSDDVATHARVCANLAFCFWNLGKPDVALRYHDATAAMWDALEVRTEAARVRWLIASMLARAGQVETAYPRFLAAQAEFEHLGMTSEAAVVGLDIAELLLAKGAFEEAEHTCRAIIQLFEAAGAAHTARALTALAFMQEAVRNRKATRATVNHVREFIRRLPHDEHLLFMPPPEFP